MEIGLPVLEKKISKGFLPYMGMAAILVKAFIQNFVQNGPVVSEKIWLEFLYVHDLGPQASIVSEKSTVLLFPIEKPKFSNLTLP